MMTGWNTTIYGVLVNRAADAVWASEENGRWSLPQATLDGNRWAIATAGQEAVSALAQLYATPVSILRRMDYCELPREHRSQILFEVEAKCAPTNRGAWVGREILGSASSFLYAPLDELFNELEAGGTVNRPAWEQRGQRSTLLDWIAGQLAKHGYQLRTVEPLRTWAQSCVLRLRTDRQSWVFKATAAFPLLGHEPLMLAQLHARFPAVIPGPLAIDEPRQWMILPDVGEPLGWDAPLSAHIALMRHWAEIQCMALEHAAELPLAGCPDRRFSLLPDHFAALLDGNLGGLGINPATAAALRRRLPRLREACWQLEQAAIPSSLVHGDLHPGNVAAQHGEMAIFDWNTACLAHPFVDTYSIYGMHNAADRDLLRDAYLAAWADSAPENELLRLWDIARPAVACHHAVSYYHIAANIAPSQRQEQQWSLHQALQAFLRS